MSTGQQLGRVGSTGNSTGPHLHFEQVRDGVKTESYFNGVASGITSDGSPSTGPLYVSGPTSPARNMTSQNCGQPANRQVYESGSHSGWQMLPVNSITGSATASMVINGNKLLYTVNGGRVYEASSDTGWRNLWTGISGVSNNALAVISVDGVKYIYTVVGGWVHEASSANGWQNLNTGISGVSNNALAAINHNGVKIIYTVVGGTVHEAASNNGWRNLNSDISGVSANALAAISLNGVKYIYTVVGGWVHEASSANGWRNLNSGISGVSPDALAAISFNGVKISIRGGWDGARGGQQQRLAQPQLQRPWHRRLGDEHQRGEGPLHHLTTASAPRTATLARIVVHKEAPGLLADQGRLPTGLLDSRVGRHNDTEGRAGGCAEAQVPLLDRLRHHQAGTGGVPVGRAGRADGCGPRFVGGVQPDTSSRDTVARRRMRRRSPSCHPIPRPPCRPVGQSGVHPGGGWGRLTHRTSRTDGRRPAHGRPRIPAGRDGSAPADCPTFVIRNGHCAPR